MSILRVGMNPSGDLTGFGIEEARSRGAKIIGSCWSPPGDCKTSGTTVNGGHLITPDEDGGDCYESCSDKIAAFAEEYDLYAMSIWQTEMSGVMYWPEQGPSATIENGVAVAGWIHSALTCDVGEREPRGRHGGPRHRRRVRRFARRDERHVVRP